MVVDIELPEDLHRRLSALVPKSNPLFDRLRRAPTQHSRDGEVGRVLYWVTCSEAQAGELLAIATTKCKRAASTIRESLRLAGAKARA